MLQVMPTRLTTELNGSGGLLKGTGTTRSFYCRQFGVEYPLGQNVRWKRTGLSTLILEFDTIWCPPSGVLVGEISSVFDCEIRHWYSEPKNGINGYDCYDGGEHMDSKMEAEWYRSLTTQRRTNRLICIWSVIRSQVNVPRHQLSPQGRQQKIV